MEIIIKIIILSTLLPSYSIALIDLGIRFESERCKKDWFYLLPYWFIVKQVIEKVRKM